MHHVGRQLLWCILLSSIASAQAPEDDKSRLEAHTRMLGDTMCALKVVSLLPLATDQTSVFSTNQSKE